MANHKKKRKGGRIELLHISIYKQDLAWNLSMNQVCHLSIKKKMLSLFSEKLPFKTLKLIHTVRKSGRMHVPFLLQNKKTTLYNFYFACIWNVKKREMLYNLKLFGKKIWEQMKVEFFKVIKLKEGLLTCVYWFRALFSVPGYLPTGLPSYPYGRGFPTLAPAGYYYPGMEILELGQWYPF